MSSRATVRRCGTTVAFALAALAAHGAEVSPADAEARAVRLYDAGDYAGAREILEGMYREGSLDGPSLYRLAFARGVAGDVQGKSQAEQQAVLALESAYAAGADLEVAFYLANAYRNSGRSADALRIASETTAAYDRGERPSPTDPLDRFRLGKLYEDQRRTDASARWYGLAVEAMDREPSNFVGYRRWAHRHLGDVAFAADDFAGAMAHYAAVTGIPGAVPEDWDRQAVAAGRLGRWEEAGRAWRAAESADPSRADRARYCRRLAGMAVALGALPSALGDGRSFRDLSKEDLEGVLKDRAAVVESTLASIRPDETLTDEARAQLQKVLDDAKPVFTAAGLEYALRGLPIRETAFVGGYAPLIFQSSKWMVPEDAPAE